MAVIICVILSAVAYVYAKWSKVDSQEIRAEDLIINQEVKKNREVDLGDGYTNVALFGVDSRYGDLGKGTRTDCIIIASLNNETKEIKLVSVYRDTLLNLSEGTYQKCNAAYSYGGPVMAINMLNMNLDLDIEDYVTVDFGAIADAIDLLGGVELDITDEEAKYLNQFLQETANSAGKEAHFIQGGGHYLMDGVQATTFARIRSTAGGDFTRTERQRLVIEKMFEKALTADLGTINEIIDAVFPQVSTSFTLQELLMYASAYSGYTLGENIGFPIDKSTDTVSGLGSIVIPENLVSNVTELHEFLFGTTGYTPSSTVQTISSKITNTVNSAGTSSSSGEEDEDDGDSHTGNSYSNGNATGNGNREYGGASSTGSSSSNGSNSGSSGGNSGSGSEGGNSGASAGEGAGTGGGSESGSSGGSGSGESGGNGGSGGSGGSGETGEGSEGSGGTGSGEGTGSSVPAE
nr:LCP family protein [uncultured Mediterraneibacter sp.]